jgi:branched-chain amino acid transport system permease protein
LLVQLVVTGLALGSMYGLVALGYHITWATSRTMNFSQGHAVMAGAVVAYTVFVALGWPFPLALVITLAALACYGALVERIAVRPFFLRASPAWLLATIAVGIIAENVAQLTFGKDARAFPSPLMRKPIFVGSAGFYPQELLVPVVGLLLMGVVQLFYHRTSYGKQLKAVAWNPEAAGLMGINIPRAVMASYALSAILAGVAGVLLAPLLNVAPQMGTTIGLKAFAVAIIGGLTSAPGIVIAGLGYGLVEAFTAGYISTRAREIVGFGLVILVLVLKPWGLMGDKPSRRV